MSNQNGYEWQGLRFPARHITTQEKELFSLRCKCGLPACILELQLPYDKTDLPELPELIAQNIPLYVYCALHSPITTTPEEDTEARNALCIQLGQPVFCPKQNVKRHAISCISYSPTCLKACTPILDLLNGIKLNTAKAAVKQRK
jgi:hypothetical protein